MSDRSAWDWMDPLGLRGSRWDPTAFMRELARGTMDSLGMIDVFGRMLRRLEGRRIDIEHGRPVSLVVERIIDSVPANEVVMGARGADVPIWREVKLGLRSIAVGDLAADRAEVTVRDVRYFDRGQQRLSVASLSARVLLTDLQFADLVATLDVPAEVTAAGPRLALRPRWSGGQITVEVTPSVKGGRLHLRPESIRLLRWTMPVPSRLPMTLDFPLLNVPEEISVFDVGTTDDGSIEVTVETAGLDVPVDLRQMLSDLGSEGARVAVRILSGDLWRGA